MFTRSIRPERIAAQSPPFTSLRRSPVPAYIIVLADVTDRDRYADYTKVTPSVVAEFGGRFIARGGRTETLEGPQETRRVVLIEFPSYELASAFYQSHGYQQAKALRSGAARATFILVDGYLPAP
jgi:uncharacterized protein (DUF1330 family)